MASLFNKTFWKFTVGLLSLILMGLASVLVLVK
jgi:hypothetical protein